MSILFEKNETAIQEEAPSIKVDFTGVEEIQEPKSGLENGAETVQPETVEPETPKTEAKKSNFDSYISHISKPRPTVAVNPHLAKKTEEKESQEADENAPKNEDGNEAPEQEKRDPEFYRSQGEFAADMTDIAMPNVIAWLNDEKDETQYCVEARIKRQIAQAYARFFEDRNKQLSPTGQLVTALAMGYGIPLGTAAFTKIMGMINKAKEQRIKEEELRLQVLQQQVHNSQVDSYESAAETLQKKYAPEQQETTPKNEPDFVATPEGEITATKEKKAPAPEPKKKTCLNEKCDKTFIEGTGHAKGKAAKYYDKFCSAGCMGLYTSMVGQQARKKKKEQKEAKKSVKNES